MEMTAALCALGLAFLAFDIGSIAFFRPAGSLSLRLKVFLGFVPVFQGAALAGLFLAPPTGWRQPLLVAGAGLSCGLFFATLASAGKQRFGPIFGRGGGSIIERGAFGWVRHPFYSTYMLCYLTLAVGSGLWPVTAGALALVGLYVHAALAEERALLDGPGGDAYVRYCLRTGRFVPRLRPARPAVRPAPLALELSHTHTK